MSSCPSQQQLQLLLSEELNEPERHRLEEHVESCFCCQDTLEQLVEASPVVHESTRRDGPFSDFVDCAAFLAQLRRQFPDLGKAGAGEVGEKVLWAAGAEGLGDGGAGEEQRRSVDGYELLGVLGRGGMAVVYKARHRALPRLVALKMIRAGTQARAEELARFRTEAEAVARLQHPNIVQIYEVGEHDGQAYLALEHVEGGSLRQKTAGLPLAVPQAVRLMQLLARAVGYAHQQGVIHRDLTPGNILLARSDSSHGVQLGEEPQCYEPKLTDFGLAKVLGSGSTGQTRSGAIMGTPSYMAPEQASGQSKKVGPLTDVYALGAVLYELLTGRPPFKGETDVDTLMQVASGRAAPPSRLQPKVPRDLDTICLRAMAKDPQDRYPGAVELADDLERFAGGRPIRARPVGRIGQLLCWCRRNPVVAGLAAAVLALGIALAAVLARPPSVPGGQPIDDSLDRVRATGKLVIGVDPDYPPMEFREDGEFSGFDVELARELTRRLGVVPEFIPAPWGWSRVVAAMDAEECDAVISSWTITEERKRQVDFVEYLQMPQVFVCRRGEEIRSEKDLAGKVLVVAHNTVGYHWANNILAKKGVTFKLEDYSDRARNAFGEVALGKADTTIIDKPVALFRIKNYPTLVVSGNVGHPMLPNPVGMVFRKRDTQLQAAVADALKGLKEDGKLAQIVERWLGP